MAMGVAAPQISPLAWCLCPVQQIRNEHIITNVLISPSNRPLHNQFSLKISIAVIAY